MEMKIFVYDCLKYGYCMHAQVPLLPNHEWDKEDGVWVKGCSGFCGRPHLYMVLWVNEKKDWYELKVGLGDEDDFEREKLYNVTKDNYRMVAHEILNWMHDMELQPFAAWELLIEMFPDI